MRRSTIALLAAGMFVFAGTSDLRRGDDYEPGSRRTDDAYCRVRWIG